MIYVYMHTVPNGKVYIGQTSNVEDRWANGTGYNDNLEFWRDIKKYGWENIKHEILKECAYRSEAIMYEMAFTILKRSEEPEFGYNKSTYVKDCNKFLQNKKEYIPPKKKQNDRGWKKQNIFIDSGLTTDEVISIIDKYVFSKKAREILKLRLIDNIDYDTIANDYKLSSRHVKRICDEWQEQIKQFI